MSALVAVLLLEIIPMLTLIRWRVETRRGIPVDARRAPTLASISYAQAVLVIIMVAAASAMARGIGAAR